MVHARFWVDDGLLFPYRIGEELPTKRPLCATWARMSHPDPNGSPDRRPIKVGEVWENPVTGERSVCLERLWENLANRFSLCLFNAVQPVIRQVGKSLQHSSTLRDLNEAAGAADASRAMLRTSCPRVTHRIAVLAHAHFLSTAKPIAYRWVKRLNSHSH